MRGAVRRFVAAAGLGTLVLLPMAAVAQQDPDEACPGGVLYTWADPERRQYALYTVDGEPEKVADLPERINAVGWSVEDRALYGLAGMEPRLIRVSPEGEWTDLGPLENEGYPGLRGAFAADFADERLLAVTKGHVVSVDPVEAAVTDAVELSEPVAVGDVALWEEALWGVDPSEGELVGIDPETGEVTRTELPGLPDRGTAGAVAAVDGALRFVVHDVDGRAVFFETDGNTVSTVGDTDVITSSDAAFCAAEPEPDPSPSPSATPSESPSESPSPPPSPTPSASPSESPTLGAAPSPEAPSPVIPPPAPQPVAPPPAPGPPDPEEPPSLRPVPPMPPRYEVDLAVGDPEPEPEENDTLRTRFLVTGLIAFAVLGGSAATARRAR
ncbi:DUF6923 family protein [Salininema proteolyticum]|uniref:DUF6923 family protein n=1 Tax=Salininema proteolyticum TaxID=1607685 RepID=A0ABV8U1B9_9ACTN